MFEKYYKNEDEIKKKIYRCYKSGVCDINGASMRKLDPSGRKVYIARPRPRGPRVKKYVFVDNKLVLKNG